MSEEKKTSPVIWIPPRRDPSEVRPYITRRPKRRRKGELNDGQWAPGYGPDAKPKKKT